MVSVGDGDLFAMKSWNVSVINVNRDPTEAKIVSPKPGGTFREGDIISFEGSAQDADGDALAYSWFEGARELGKGRTMELALLAGAHAVILKVSDGTATVSTPQLQFVVKPNAPPQLYSLDPSNGQKFEKGAKIYFVATAGDTDGDNLTYCWTESGRPISTSPSFYKSDLSVGSHMIQLTISDGRASTNTTLTIQITQPATEGGGSELMLMMVGVILAVVVAALAVVFMRRKKPPMAVAQPVDTEVDELLAAQTGGQGPQ
jgi:hypothetical protein